jgi:hypothetical protein
MSVFHVTQQENPCPAGTIGDEIELIREEQCTPCPDGKFCATPGKSVVTGDCDPGLVNSIETFHQSFF